MLSLALIISGVLIISSVISRQTAIQVTTDMLARDPAIVFRNLEILTTAIKPGQPVDIAYDYDKRADCYPPKGYGDFFYRVFVMEPDGSYKHFFKIDSGLTSIEPPGMNQHAVNQIKLPMLPAGNYALQFRAVFQCQGERDLQFITPDKMPFTLEAS